MPILKLYIDRKVADLPGVVSMKSRFNLPFSIVQNAREVFEAVSSADDPVQKGKEVLFLTQNKGAFIRNCPGTSYYTCCGYEILHIGTFCVMDCAYCILQSYFHPPVLQYFVNHDRMLAELDSLFAKKKRHRIGTGEFTDSMIWEMWTDLSDLLVPKFAGQSHSILELKTKTTAIDKLKHINHNRKTIVSWSLNTNKVIQNEERNTTSLSARLKAAAKCESWGYQLAFHFDPMVIYDGCEEDYREVINQLFSHISAKNIVWISLGTFRFMPSLKSIIQKRFPESKIIYGEFISGMDGKMRYFKPLRIKLYRKIVSWIKEIAPDVLIYYCMEDDEVWEKSLGFVPSDKGGLPLMLDNSAMQHCGLEA
ncbi:MAG: DNA photolyase [Deltaproteobacteria bacterium]|nr:DNA photolyase [Deltaproteobacteria bacterium]MBW2661680.1 DNA photolyase [Deltaproteobacteria bacterium]